EDDISNFFVELKTSFVTVPVILMYDPSARDSVKGLFKKAHPDAMIRKPFKLMELLDKINNVLYSGTLYQYPFPFLVQTFYDESRTGVLHITVEGTKFFVYFIDGEIVYIEYGLRKDTLGMLLLRREKINEEQYNAALADASQNHSRLGVSLIKLGYLTPTELNEALQDQVSEKIMNCFADKEGTFSFKFMDRFVDDIVIYKQAAQKVIFEGIKRHYDEKRMEQFLNTIKSKRFKISNEMQSSIDKFKFNTNELKIVSKIKTMCSYDELSLKPDMDKQLLLQILYALSVTRCLVVTSKGEELKDEPADELPEENEEILSADKKSTSTEDLVYETYLKVKSANYYEILAVPRDADTKQIKTSYMELAKYFHPDKFSESSKEDVIMKVTEIFAKLSNAVKVLTDPTEKKAYDYKLDNPKEAELLESANEIMESEVEFLKGEKLLNQRDFSEAEHSFDVAMQLNPKEPEYKCYYGWAHFLNPENDKAKKVNKAKRLIVEGLKERMENAKGHFFLGSILKFEHNFPLAIKHLKIAVKLDPDDSEAAIVLKVLESKAKK
ncbi:DUF4388 domain-containing protein, partial [Thermodesulfobacteriota bacterium]